MHTTSLNIKQDIFELMEAHALKMNIPVSGLIKHLIARFSKRFTSQLNYRECSVAYQPPDAEFHLFVITYSDEEYEQVLDIRKVWKLSVSFFVLWAFLHYLYCSSTGDKTESKRVLVYSYMLVDYHFQKILTKEGLSFVLIWGKSRTNPKKRQ